MKGYLTFLWQCFRLSFKGDWKYHLWMFGLTAVALLGLNAYCRQFVHGLITTGMTDQVSWGLYIANFDYLVGNASAVVLLVIPVFLFKNHELDDLVILGQLLAVATVVMCLLFVVVDMGRPDRSLHLLFRFHFPVSMLTWDVVVLNGYLFLNVYVCGYLIHCAYQRKRPSKLFYVPFMFITVGWAISVHTVTAFLYSGLGGRPFWNSAVIAPRFLASAFASGPALIILTLQVIRWATPYPVTDAALHMLRRFVTIALGVNLFLFGSEVFTEFYTDSSHVAAAKYLYFGLHGRTALVPWIWTAIVLDCTAMVILLTPWARRLPALNLACVAMIIGIWIEKGMGAIVPGFVPSPLGEIVEYIPTLNETLVSLGIWAFGLLLYTIFVRVTIPVLQGELLAPQAELEGSAARWGSL
ncbi:MAG: polysulfide reductase NrfD [Phycisphaerales bacterium]|nr:polysulfide reductase NrfD [Phycisphaerales bacterium]